MPVVLAVRVARFIQSNETAMKEVDAGRDRATPEVTPHRCTITGEPLWYIPILINTLSLVMWNIIPVRVRGTSYLCPEPVSRRNNYMHEEEENLVAGGAGHCKLP
jgi:hypothetical protein